jgi:hypothetical protein
VRQCLGGERQPFSTFPSKFANPVDDNVCDDCFGKTLEKRKRRPVAALQNRKEEGGDSSPQSKWPSRREMDQMTGFDRSSKFFRTTLAGLGLAISLAAAGCQVHVAGKTLPSPYYLTDDLQYHAPGPEFKLANEAAALRAQAAEVVSVPPPPVQP